MSLPPNTTPVPTSILVPAMSPAAEPTPSPVPTRPRPPHTSNEHGDKNKDEEGDGEAFTLPTLRLEIRDLSHPGAASFLRSVHASDAVDLAARNVLRLLYTRPSCPTTTAPPTRSITLVVRDMPGVAYTTGIDLDPTHHKEVHFSARYIAGIKPASRLADEIAGVLTHEFVHCFQYNGFHTCPGGLVEGVADWVRLRCRLAPPHWRRESGDGGWDRGYQHTAYFLDYLEDRFGAGTVRRLNEKLRIQRYEEKPFWTELVGRPVEQLWEDYCEKLKDEDTVLVSREEASGDEVQRTVASGQDSS